MKKSDILIDKRNNNILLLRYNFYYKGEMEKELKEKLKQEGRSLKWFHAQYVSILELSYNAMALQLNGYSAMQEKLKSVILKYLKEE